MSTSVPFTTMAALLGVKTPRDPITAHALQGLFCFLIGNDVMNLLLAKTTHLNAATAVF